MTERKHYDRYKLRMRLLALEHALDQFERNAKTKLLRGQRVQMLGSPAYLELLPGKRLGSKNPDDYQLCVDYQFAKH